MKAIGIASIIGVVVVAMLAGALYISRLLTPGASTCTDMASLATSPEAAKARRINVVVGLAGNGAPMIAEAQQFVAAALQTTRPDALALVTVTLVNGDRVYRPSGRAGDCIGAQLLVAPAQADLDAYTKASSAAKRDIETSLRNQYVAQVQRVSDAVAHAIGAAPAPESGDAGAFALWPFVAQTPSDREVVVLGPFSVGGDNCLTVNNPASPGSDGTTIIETRMAKCVAAKEVSIARAASVRLTPVATLGDSGTKRDAQLAVVNALCRHATEHGCS